MTDLKKALSLVTIPQLRQWIDDLVQSLKKP